MADEMLRNKILDDFVSQQVNCRSTQLYDITITRGHVAMLGGDVGPLIITLNCKSTAGHIYEIIPKVSW